MKIALIDYNMGNLGSVLNALGSIGAEAEVISTPQELKHFNGCILPGVGNFGDGMENLSSAGLVSAIREHISGGKYLFGICLGMQMLLESSDESPGAAGIGIFPGRVCRFSGGSGLKVPQINWNKVEFVPGSLWGVGLPPEPWFYFVHSYYVPQADYTVATAEYGGRFSAAIGKANCFATQFHPEKSQNCGMTLLKNFVTAAAGESL